jgi:hypothetical protein
MRNCYHINQFRSAILTIYVLNTSTIFSKNEKKRKILFRICSTAVFFNVYGPAGLLPKIISYFLFSHKIACLNYRYKLLFFSSFLLTKMWKGA